MRAPHPSALHVQSPAAQAHRAKLKASGGITGIPGKRNRAGERDRMQVREAEVADRREAAWEVRRLLAGGQERGSLRYAALKACELALTRAATVDDARKLLPAVLARNAHPLVLPAALAVLDDLSQQTGDQATE